MIYQQDEGRDNTGKTPLGGIINQTTPAVSMVATIANPTTLYYGGSGAVINQAGHSGDLYDYYWTSYSRGTDGRTTTTWANEPNWHNGYLDGYIPLRVKSIYDPCPYLYRIPTNGTFNQFASNAGWTLNSYLGGVSCATTLGESWFLGLGRRGGGSSVFEEIGREGYYYSSISVSQTIGYMLGLNADLGVFPSWYYARSYGMPVRCIEGSTFFIIMHRICTIFAMLF